MIGKLDAAGQSKYIETEDDWGWHKAGGGDGALAVPRDKVAHCLLEDRMSVGD